MGKILFKGLV